MGWDASFIFSYSTYGDLGGFLCVWRRVEKRNLENGQTRGFCDCFGHFVRGVKNKNFHLTRQKREDKNYHTLGCGIDTCLILLRGGKLRHSKFGWNHYFVFDLNLYGKMNLLPYVLRSTPKNNWEGRPSLYKKLSFDRAGINGEKTLFS
jgi:hypothetical protein